MGADCAGAILMFSCSRYVCIWSATHCQCGSSEGVQECLSVSASMQSKDMSCPCICPELHRSASKD